MLADALVFCLVVTGLIIITVTLALWFGGPDNPPPMRSINAPFESRDFADLPPVRFFKARDGSKLGYRHYRSDGLTNGSVVLVHGSSANSASLQYLAVALSAQGYPIFSLDMRGHGA